MIHYFVKRLFAATVTLFFVSLLIFSIVKCMPNDPVQSYLGLSSKATVEQKEQLREHLGIDQPLGKQYVIWINRMIRGDFGTSLYDKKEVKELILEKLPYSIGLYGSSLLLAVIVSSVLDVIAVIQNKRRIDQVFHIYSYVVLSLPSFFVGMIILYGFYSIGGVFIYGTSDFYYSVVGYPSIGMKIGDLLFHAFLPCLTMTVLLSASFLRYLLAHLKQEAVELYALCAKAKGLSKWKIAWVHLYRNVLSSFLTYLASYFPIMISGCMLIEILFEWEGLGKLLYRSLHCGDESVMCAVLFLTAAASILGNVFFDILALKMHPLIKESYVEGESNEGLCH